jgi:hypothetical protein
VTSVRGAKTPRRVSIGEHRATDGGFIVPYSALKAIFFVEQWDSRAGVEQVG